MGWEINHHGNKKLEEYNPMHQYWLTEPVITLDE